MRFREASINMDSLACPGGLNKLARNWELIRKRGKSHLSCVAQCDSAISLQWTVKLWGRFKGPSDINGSIQICRDSPKVRSLERDPRSRKFSKLGMYSKPERINWTDVWNRHWQISSVFYAFAIVEWSKSRRLRKSSGVADSVWTIWIIGDRCHFTDVKKRIRFFSMTQTIQFAKILSFWKRSRKVLGRKGKFTTELKGLDLEGAYQQRMSTWSAGGKEMFCICR